MAVLIIASIVLSTIIRNKNIESRPNPDPSNNSSKTKFIPENNTTDTDNDSLEDWKEKLWQTDYQKPDTDEDGTPDGIEVAQNRDPRKKPPDLITAEVERELFETKTKTDYILNQNKKTDTSPALPLESKISSPLRDYGNTLGAILQTHEVATKKETDIILAVLAKPNTNDFDQLKIISSAYKSTAYKISTIKIMPETLEINKKLGESYEMIGVAMEKISSYKSGVVTTSEFESYNAAVLENAKILNTLLMLFSKNNISFSNTDPGRIFTIGI